MAKGTVIKAKNKSGITISANKAVYISGYDEIDNIPLINLSSNNNDITMPSVGITTEDIDNMTIGTIKTSGLLGNFDTSRLTINDDVFIGLNGGIIFSDPTNINDLAIAQQIGVVSRVGEYPDGQIMLFSLELNKKISHNNLTNIEEDQHLPKKIREDGSRGFTGQINGVLPISPSHLTTKSYVDSEINKIVNISGSIFKHKSGESSITAYGLAGAQTAQSTGQNSITQNIIYALPIIVPEWSPVIISQLSIRAYLTQAGNTRIGIYKNIGAGNLYPGVLLYDSGNIDTSTSQQYTASPNLTIVAGELLWLTLITSATRQFVTFSTTISGRFTIGYEDITGTAPVPTLSHKITQVFGAFPNPMPTAGRTAGTGSQTDSPCIWALFA